MALNDDQKEHLLATLQAIIKCASTTQLMATMALIGAADMETKRKYIDRSASLSDAMYQELLKFTAYLYSEDDKELLAKLLAVVGGDDDA